jgi:hypothetical protein
VPTWTVVRRGHASLCPPYVPKAPCLKNRGGRDKPGHDGVYGKSKWLSQIRSGNRMMKLSRFGICTFGSVVWFISSLSPMSLLAASR